MTDKEVMHNLSEEIRRLRISIDHLSKTIEIFAPRGMNVAGLLRAGEQLMSERQPKESV